MDIERLRREIPHIEEENPTMPPKVTQLFINELDEDTRESLLWLGLGKDGKISRKEGEEGFWMHLKRAQEGLAKANREIMKHTHKEERMPGGTVMDVPYDRDAHVAHHWRNFLTVRSGNLQLASMRHKRR